MQSWFTAIADHLQGSLRGGEVFTARFNGEDSDFVRFNHNAVRQAMHVKQASLRVQLIDGKRQARGEITLSGEASTDRERASSLVKQLRDMVAQMPDDPYLLYATEVHDTERVGTNHLQDTRAAVSDLLQAGEGTDLVGLYAAGGIFSGFANSLGQRNWFASWSHNLDWSLYHTTDKAVKCQYAGFEWDGMALVRKMMLAREQLSTLSQTPRTLTPGRYRVYLAPAALQRLLDMMAWGGFGLKDHRTRQTPLIRMVEDDARLHSSLRLAENTREGVGADFQDQGFIRPSEVVLIDAGAYRDCLVSPRSAQEYGVSTNGASEGEAPESLDVAAGTLPQDEMLSRLDTGLYVNNLHYLNFSDRPCCRITGMTRFATFWVENGRIQAPVNVMRFDETIYRVLGENLVGLTREREMILDSMTYGRRSTDSSRLPGALVEDFAFTL